MDYVRLGRTGLKVSRIALGCMSYGDPGFHQWTLDEEASQPFFRQAVELGITLWDTANGYGGGTSEEYVGRAVKTYARREDIVLATKVHNTMHDGPGGSGLSRKAILEYGPDRDGLGAEQTGRHGPDCRRHQTSPPRRGSGRPRDPAD